LDYLLELFKYNALFAVVSAGYDYDKKVEDLKGNVDDAWNACSLAWVNAVRAHCYTFMMFNFIQEINECTDKAIKAVLSKVCALFALNIILEDTTWNLPHHQFKFAREAAHRAMNDIRPDAVALVDAFDISDNVLNSVIGRFDGNVYEALYESAKKSPLNQVDPFEGYKEYLQPHLDREFLKKGNKVPSKL